MTGLRRPAKTWPRTSCSSLIVPMYEPSNDNWREKRKRRSSSTFGPVVAPQVTSVPPVLSDLHALLPGGGTDVFDDDVHTFEVGDLADFLRNLLLVVVDDEIGAEFAGALHLAFVAGGGDHAGVKHLRNLDGRNARRRSSRPAPARFDRDGWRRVR